jgi:chemotaxis protein MotB
MLKHDTEGLLATIAGELGRLKNPVVVEGHTDARPYADAKGTYSNWELSSDRANAARRVMAGAGLREDQVVAVRGYAAMHLRTPDDPMDPRNRRVSILVPALAMTPEEAARIGKLGAASVASTTVSGAHGAVSDARIAQPSESAKH